MNRGLSSFIISLNNSTFSCGWLLVISPCTLSWQYFFRTSSLPFLSLLVSQFVFSYVFVFFTILLSSFAVSFRFVLFIIFSVFPFVFCSEFLMSTTCLPDSLFFPIRPLLIFLLGLGTRNFLPFVPVARSFDSIDFLVPFQGFV